MRAALQTDEPPRLPPSLETIEDRSLQGRDRESVDTTRTSPGKRVLEIRQRLVSRPHAGSRVTPLKEETPAKSAADAHSARTRRPAPGSDEQTADVCRGLDRQPSHHRPELFEAPLPLRVGDHLGGDREEVKQAEHDPDGRRSVPNGGSDAEAEHGDLGEVENRTDGGAHYRRADHRWERVPVSRGEAIAGQDEPAGQQAPNTAIVLAASTKPPTTAALAARTLAR